MPSNRDNRLDRTPQPDGGTGGAALDDWIGFLRSRRLAPTREAPEAVGAPSSLLDAVAAVEAALPGLRPEGAATRAALIHGDLWSGNVGELRDGRPVIYDPAVHCADADAHLAMLELFGNWPAGFGAAYAAHRPLVEGAMGGGVRCTSSITC